MVYLTTTSLCSYFFVVVVVVFVIFFLKLSSFVSTPNTNKMQSPAVTVLAAMLVVSLVMVSCTESGSVSDTSNLRVRRSSSDQRIAELQALMALSGNGGRVAHGQFDPLRIGKKKRDFTEEQRYLLLKNLIERAVENNTPQ